MALLVALFSWPAGEPATGAVTVGSIDDFGIGSVTTYADGEFHLVRLSEDEFIALGARGSHVRACFVPWRPDFVWSRDGGTRGWFRDPCSGSTYDKEGHRVFGPAPCDLARLPVRFVSDKVVVDNVHTECVRTL